MTTTPLYCAEPARRDTAQQLAARFALTLVGQRPQEGYWLELGPERLELLTSGKHGAVYAEFVEGAARHRREQGGGRGQPVAKAIGLKGAKALPRVVDKSAGEYAGHDALTARLEAGPAPATEAPRSIRAFVSVQDEVELMARTARDEGWKRVLLLTVEDRYGDSAAKLLPANLPAGVKLTRLPLRRDALAMDAIGPESAGGAYDPVCVFAHGPEIAPALKALRQSGHRGAIVGNHAFAGKSVGMLDRPVLLGLRYTGPAFCAGKDTPMSERFRGEYREYNRDEPDLFAALGYDQVMLVFSAAKAEETLAAKPIRRRIIGDKTFEGAAGTYAFDADGEARMELSLHPVIPAKAPKPVR